MQQALLRTSWYAGALALALGLFLSLTLTARADTTTFSGITVTPSSNTAIINWNTNTNANSSVAYGSSNLYGTNTAVNSTLGTTHSVTLTGLQPGTTYHFSVMSADSSNVMASSTDMTFTTTGTASGSTGSGSGVASVSLSSPSGAIGSQLSYSGNGFVPYETVTLNFNGSNMGTLTADASGNLSSSLTVPSGSAVGNTSLRLTGVSSGRIATGAFTVNASANASGNVDVQALSSLVASLQMQISDLLSRIASLEANLNANTTVSGSVSGDSGNGLRHGDKLYVGTISNVANGSFMLKSSNGKSYTVNVESGATLWNKSRTVVPWSKYSNGDSVRVDASASGSSTLNADILRDMSI